MTSLQVHDEYTALHDAAESTNGILETIQCGTVEQRAVWAARRACFWYGRYPRPGTAESTRAALRAAHGQTLLCRVPECRALVDLQSARRIARAAGRDRFEPGDGCGSKSCSAKFWRSRFRSQQLKMATALRDNKRVLVLWPASTTGRATLRVAPAALTAAAAETAALVYSYRT